jgi:hypothetical protein
MPKMKPHIRLYNAGKLFVWALQNPKTLNPQTFKLLGDLLGLIMKAATEHRHMMTHIAYVHPENEKKEEIVSIWAGAGANTSPTGRIKELKEENQKLKTLLKEATTK